MIIQIHKNLTSTTYNMKKLKKIVLELLKIIMTEEHNIKHQDYKNTDELNDICDECKKTDESVTQNLILTGFKICKSCRVSKTIFPI